MTLVDEKLKGVVVIFTAKNCAPCAKFKSENRDQIISEISKINSLKLINIDLPAIISPPGPEYHPDLVIF